MSFRSILFEQIEDSPDAEPGDAPVFFGDLNLNQLVATITAGKQEYNLLPFYYAPLRSVKAIQYRQEIMQDLEHKALLESINAFAQKMRSVRRHLALIEKLHFTYHKEGWFLETVSEYCDTITCLVTDLNQASLQSSGLRAFREYVTNYASSSDFTTLMAEAKELQADLAAIRYCVLIRADIVKVRRYEAEIDYSVDVQATFEKFKQGAVKDYRAKLAIGSGMNHVEAQILNLVAKLHPEVFAALDSFCGRHSGFLDDMVLVFDREIQFYVAYLEHISTVQEAGLAFCYPQISDQSKEVYNTDGFDLALATIRVREDAPVVCNDFYLKGPERVLVVSGPNQGGKTTFARTFGQLHYLAALGCPVPGREAQLYLFDRLFTHFEREETIQNLRGKLQDDLVRIHAILDQATPRSIFILNEVFSSTSLQDEVFLSKKTMERIVQLDLLAVWVTFIDELATFSEQTVSMISMVVPEYPALRTYKILRRPPDGLAYALSIAEKYRLTYASLKERIRS